VDRSHIPSSRNQPNSREKNARFHGRVFKMYQISRKIRGRSLRNSREKNTGPTGVISRCCVNAN